MGRSSTIYGLDPVVTLAAGVDIMFCIITYEFQVLRFKVRDEILPCGAMAASSGVGSG